jgi:hypothetical protein
MEDRNECDKPCGMNYCDENGCTNRKRDLVDLVDVIKDNSIDWNQLREEFFSEHTDKDTGGFIHITTAPHDLFMWFRNKIEK